MAHVFRFHKGTDTIDGWQETAQVGDKDIEAIDDPNGARASLPITSIPTPFAGFELTKTAFAYCAQPGEQRGSTIYHKLVAQALDVLEIFFGYHTHYERQFQLLVWDRQRHMQALASDGSAEHASLAATLSLFLSQDAQAFHFDQLQHIYMLNYIGPSTVAHINVVGCTSPTSLTMASPNDLSYVRGVWLGNYHEAFQADADGTYRSLIDRAAPFRQFVYLLSRQPEVNAMYGEWFAYVDASFKADNDTTLKNALNSMPPSAYHTMYQPLTIGNSQLLLPGGTPLCCQRALTIERDSDFRILTSQPMDRVPLALPSAPYFQPSMRYTSADWTPQIMAPLSDDRPLDERTLPYDGALYPYITADDVFQPSLLRLPYTVNADAMVAPFYSDGRADADHCQYLLPLRPLVMQYLSAQTLAGTTADTHEPVFALYQQPDGNIRAILRIPVQQGRYITMQRDYSPVATTAAADLWPVVEARIDLFLFPSYHILDAQVATPQRIYLVDEDTVAHHIQYEYEVQAWQEGAKAPLPMTVVDRADKHEQFLTTRYFCLDSQYHFLTVTNGTDQALLIPRFGQLRQGQRAFQFAIDFGTTNTHIEYKDEMENITRPLTIERDEQVVLTLNAQTPQTIAQLDAEGLETFFGGPAQAFMQEFMPVTIGSSHTARFPMRTNLCMRSGHTVQQREPLAMADYNVGFHYEREDTFDYNETHTDLKWENTRSNNLLVEAYFEQLLMLIRSKVLLGGGMLQRTSITWFYPVCMQPYQIAALDTTWQRLTRRLLSPQGVRMQRVAESLAPYYYYTQNQDVDAETRPVVSMDIGGGTTDFVVYHRDNTAVLISSVRFAGNSIYGDFLGRATEYNGFIRAFAPLFDQRLRDISGVSDVYEKSKRSGAEFVSFLYSLDSNPRMQGSGISFSDELRDNAPFRMVLLLFYAAEIYYAAHLLAMKQLPTPAYVTVSGTASKVLPLIGSSEALQQMARCIFNDVLGDDHRVELKWVDNPKEITCKGGLNMRDRFVVNDVEQITRFHTGSARLDAMTTPHYRDIDDKVRKEVMQSYQRFIDYFFSLNERFNYSKYFGVAGEREYAHMQQILTDKAEQDFNKTIAARREDPQGEVNPEINDSLFFIPLTGGLSRLALDIAMTKI